MNTCERLKHYLLKHGREPIQRQGQFDEHLLDCDDCRLLLQSWDRIPGLLESLPEHEPNAALLRRTRQAIKTHEKTPVAANRLPRLATSLASVVVLLAVIGLSRQLIENEYPALMVPASKEEYAVVTEYRTESTKPSGQVIDGPLVLKEQIGDTYGLEAEEDTGGFEKGMTRGHAAGDDMAQPVSRNGRGDTEAVEQEQSRIASRRKSESKNRPVLPDGRVAGSDVVVEAEPRQNTAAPAEANQSVIVGGKLQAEVHFASKPDPSKEAGQRDRLDMHKADKSRDSRDRFDADEKPARLTPETDNSEMDGEYFYADEASVLRNEEKRKTSQMLFQPAQGYWANTHIPGDPNIRLLKARLAGWDRSGLGRGLVLEQDVRPVSQPFDAPTDNALALSLMSDANAVDGATRMLLQVGVRGIEHRRGQRPAMNMGVVIDLPADADDDTRIAARALLDAVLASKQPGDRFSLVINGPGGLVVPPDEFRFGPLQLARQAIIGSESSLANAKPGLQDAIREVSALVRQTDDPGQPLGSSSVLLISANDLGNVDALSEQIHDQAKDGITLSMVPLGKRPQSNQVEQLVLAGLGNRRILQAPDQARQLIEAELHSSSRAVARAARLSIRLAPGVHLIDVVGSGRLDAEKSRRVHEIENSMDRRLSANLGIQADRGGDEDGIQIVIPSIFSGDDVTVLLDVMVEHPGEVASVSLRYKDLVYLHNGSLRGQLSLPAGQLQRGPAEFAVLKNLLAQHFSTAAGRAADALGRQKPAEAVAILSDMRDQIVNMRSTVPAFSKDPDLLHDEQILDSYISLLASPGAGTYQLELVDSLRYAAWAKAHRPLVEWK